MTREEAARIGNRLTSKRIRSLLSAWVWLVLSIALGVGALQIREVRLTLIFVALSYVGFNQMRLSFSRAALAKKDLMCESCGNLNTTLLNIIESYYDTTETRTRRTTYHGNDGSEIAYSETPYEVPTVGKHHVSYMQCNACKESFKRKSGSSVLGLIGIGGDSGLGTAFVWIIASFVLSAVYMNVPAGLTFHELFERLQRWASNAAPAGVIPPAEVAGEPLTENSRISLYGIGPVRIGMNLEEASAAAGQPLVGSNPEEGNQSCYEAIHQEGLEGISFIINNGQVAVVHIMNEKLATLRGARVGQSMEDVLNMYPNELTEEPAIEGRSMFTYTPNDQKDKNLRLKFLSDEGVIIAISVGRLPEIEAEEFCY